MADRSIREQAIALYDHFTHEGADRRAFMAELTRLAGGAAAAQALLAGIAANPAAAAIVPPDDRRLKAREIAWPFRHTGRRMKGYWVRPARARGPLPVVMVVHENRGLNAHIRDIARRLALEGFAALAPDFLSIAGGTPDDEDKARSMISALNLGTAVADGAGTIRWLKSRRQTTGKVGIVGFCWGGAMVNRLAAAAGDALAAGVAYYGPAPDPSEARTVKAPMMLHYAGLDERVNKTAEPWIAALKANGVAVESFTYEGVNHAFNNDTSAERYDAAAAKLAWGRTIAFLKQHLA